MKNLIYLGILGFLMFCNNADTTSFPHDVDNTDVDDSLSSISNLPLRDSLSATPDSLSIDSLGH